MSRALLDPSRIHPAAQRAMGSLHADIVAEVEAAAQAHPVLVVGMAGNPFVGRARRALTQAGVSHHDLDYGSYFSGWRRRNALKMWSGWPTFPMVFVRGVLVGGASDVEALIGSGELKTLLG